MQEHNLRLYGMQAAEYAARSERDSRDLVQAAVEEQRVRRQKSQLRRRGSLEVRPASSLLLCVQLGPLLAVSGWSLWLGRTLDNWSVWHCPAPDAIRTNHQLIG
jgi:hypothetical protein